MSANDLHEDQGSAVNVNLFRSSVAIAVLVLFVGLGTAFSAASSAFPRAIPVAPRAAVPELSGPAIAPPGTLAGGSRNTVPEEADEALTPRMLAVLEQVTRRYRVSSEALRPIFQAAQSTGRERNLDPLLIVAVIGVESGFNPFSESSMGALGLMQLIPRFHQEKLPAGAGKAQFLDPVVNVQVGTHVLQESIRRNGGLIAGLQQFGGAINDEGQAYANKVLAEKERLELAVRPAAARKAPPPVVEATEAAEEGAR